MTLYTSAKRVLWSPPSPDESTGILLLLFDWAAATITSYTGVEFGSKTRMQMHRKAYIQSCSKISQSEEQPHYLAHRSNLTWGIPTTVNRHFSFSIGLIFIIMNDVQMIGWYDDYKPRRQYGSFNADIYSWIRKIG
ncbi:uncharacterized protein TRIADDRAFT_60132 [Trichoplax adhaerens]|uniref:Uncharacterized protein n=1 Tax=Trichoplax adhaerens TaxID=10228 RepID=B3S7E0_TRIAD|nr:predicted protein [Trichoplax adhaerens]EDV21181.1 predicted protein [Trichoplax adhaerens]|eukprot:XP_002116148.1 predicted protein [Trichoplax adhaerens]